jgi:hypothetical protein
MTSTPFDSPHTSAADQPLAKSMRSRQARLKGDAKASDSGEVTKKKQSKSRNGTVILLSCSTFPYFSVEDRLTKTHIGCVTCKAKRLKCDEVKPTCQKCEDRQVPCGGYHKDFKWRPFEEPGCAVKRRPSKARSGKLSSTAQTPISC